MLESSKYVDNVVLFDEDTPLNLIKSLNPDIIVKGGDYNVEDVAGHEVCEVRIFNFIEGFSTTKVLEEKNNV